MSHSPLRGADDSPGLFRDRAFWGMTGTQFLGAFNDNVFKQLVLLICVDFERATGVGYYQSIATALFAIPFVLFSGLAGYLSDRLSKRRIVVLMKVAEIVIMLAGMSAFFLGGVFPAWQLPMLFAVLFLMSTQSAFFGPSKYGILPELFADRDLPQANGLIQMTTFLAIIFGMVAAGYGKEWFPSQLWMVSAMCVVIAVAGTMTSLLVRPTPVARPNLEFEWSAMAINRETWKMLRGDKLLMEVLLISSVFWFLGGVMMQATNTFGKILLQVGDAGASLLGVFMGIGIAIGCVVAGKLSHEKINFHLVRIGSWGLAGALVLLLLMGLAHTAAAGSFWEKLVPRNRIETICQAGMLGVGFFGGLFIVPLQVFMQARPPEDLKGRMIGAMNLVNWIAICFAAVFVGLANFLLEKMGLGVNWIFGMLALILLPIAIFYHPPDETLSAAGKRISE